MANANVPAALTRYAAAGLDALDLVGRVAELVRSMRDPAARALRVRRRAARTLRRAHLADARGREDRADRLRVRACDLWREADALVASLDGAEPIG